MNPTRKTETLSLEGMELSVGDWCDVIVWVDYEYEDRFATDADIHELSIDSVKIFDGDEKEFFGRIIPTKRLTFKDEHKIFNAVQRLVER